MSLGLVAWAIIALSGIVFLAVLTVIILSMRAGIEVDGGNDD